jgi:hypothetical protein
MLFLTKIFKAVYIYISSARVIEQTHGDAQYQGTGCYICELSDFFEVIYVLLFRETLLSCPGPRKPALAGISHSDCRASGHDRRCLCADAGDGRTLRCCYKRSVGELKATFWPFNVQ